MPSPVAPGLTFRPYCVEDIPELNATINSAFEADKFFKYPEYYDRSSEPMLHDNLSLQESLYNTYLVGVFSDNAESMKIPCCTLLTHGFTFTIQYHRQTTTPPPTTTDDKHQSSSASETLSYNTREFTLQERTEDYLKIKAELATALASHQNIQIDDNDNNNTRVTPNTGINNNTTPSTPLPTINIDKIIVQYDPHISCVSVHQKYQGQGIGKVLVKKSEEYCISYIRNSIVQDKLGQLISLIFSPNDFKFTNNEGNYNNIVLNDNIRIVSHLEVLLAVRPELCAFYQRQGYVIIKEIEFSAKFICLPQYDFKSNVMEKVLQE